MTTKFSIFAKINKRRERVPQGRLFLQILLFRRGGITKEKNVLLSFFI